MAQSDAVLDIGARLLEGSHRLALALTGGRWPKQVLGMEPVELHVKGRKSGKRYSSMLTAPICEPDRVILVASKGGHSDHPDWYKNLVANPDVEITVKKETKPYTARTASTEEKAQLWPTIVGKYKGYDGYQQNTDRDIPVIICTPR
jgi:deazaflavin-dependent oxidoreductase (nitroreductase family)